MFSPANEVLIQKIQAEFPEFQFKDVKRIETGGKHLVLIFDSRWVFRFERNETPESAARFKQELKLLDALRKLVTVTLPNYSYVSKTGFFGGHQLLLGIPLSAQRFSTFPDQRSDEILRHLAQFLKSLHSLPLSLFHIDEGDGLNSWPMQRYADRYSFERREKILPHVDTKLLEHIDTFFQRYAEHDFPKTAIVHADFREAHILIEQGGLVPGVIDFGDVRIGDPAEDIAFFWSYGEDALDKVLEEYNPDAGLKLRSEIHFVRYGVDQLYYGVQIGDTQYVSFIAELLEYHLKKIL